MTVSHGTELFRKHLSTLVPTMHFLGYSAYLQEVLAEILLWWKPPLSPSHCKGGSGRVKKYTTNNNAVCQYLSTQPCTHLDYLCTTVLLPPSTT